MRKLITICLTALIAMPVWAQMGRRFPSERKVIKDPKTGDNNRKIRFIDLIKK